METKPATPKPLVTLVGPGRPFRGGIAHFQTRLAHELRRSDCRVEEVSFTRQYPSLLFPGKTQVEPGENGGGARRIIDSINPFTWARAAQVVASLTPDVVVFQHWLPFFAPAFARIARTANRQGIPTIAVVHNAIPHDRRIGDRALTRLFLQRCDLLVALSETVAADLKRLGINRPTRILPHPVYDDFGDLVPRAEARAALGIDGEAPTVLFFGFVRKYKGLDLLIDAIGRVRAEMPKIRLIIAGEFYEDVRHYRKSIAEAGISDATTVENRYIPTEEVPLFFCASDVVVQPYKTATQSGIAALARHFERPVIVTDVGGLGEEVADGKTGFVVPPNDPEAIRAAVMEFFRSEADWAAEIRNRTRDNDWKLLASAILSRVRHTT